jgi:hypothetical protein
MKYNEEKLKQIDRDAHYYVLMHPLEGFNLNGVEIRYCTNRTRAKWVECEIVEENYKFDDGFKIELRSVEPGYGKETFYTDDFISCLAQDRIVKKVPNMECVEETWKEPLTKNVYVRHSAYTLKIKPNKK